MFSLSTVWNSTRWEDGRKVAEEIYRLGFERFELNFSLTKAMVSDIAFFIREHGLAVSSLHNYCPIPEGLTRQEALPDCFSLSSVDEDERRRAVEQTMITIRTAQELGAAAVVLHAGRVEIEDKTRELIEAHNRGESRNSHYQDLRDDFMSRRSQRAAEHMVQVERSLKDLSRVAASANVLLGLENRFYYREIPFGDEFATLFESLGRGPVRFWLDVGHEYILARLGFMEHRELVSRFGHLLAGIHLHNVRDLVDHQAPQEGEIDLSYLKPYARPETIKVIEVHRQVAEGSIRDAVPFLTRIFG